MPFKYKIIAVCFVLSNLFAVWATYQVTSGRYAKKENKVYKAEIKDDNQDKIAITESKSEIGAKVNEATKTIIKSQTKIIYINNCPPDFSGMRNETAEESSKLHLHGLE